MLENPFRARIVLLLGALLCALTLQAVMDAFGDGIRPNLPGVDGSLQPCPPLFRVEGSCDAPIP